MTKKEGQSFSANLDLSEHSCNFGLNIMVTASMPKNFSLLKRNF